MPPGSGLHSRVGTPRERGRRVGLRGSVAAGVGAAAGWGSVRAQSSSTVDMRVRMAIMAFVCSWQIRLSVTPRTRPISASVSPS